MKTKALLSDLDGTLVTGDTSTRLLSLVNKTSEGEQLFQNFQAGRSNGYDGLIARINMLTGLSITEIKKEIVKDLALAKGARELFKHCKDNGIITIVASGCIEPVLNIYKQELNADYVVGTRPRIKKGVLTGISQADFPQDDRHFKVVGISTILSNLHISGEECVALGDGRADLPMFGLADLAIAINPKGGIEEHADLVAATLFDVIKAIPT